SVASTEKWHIGSWHEADITETSAICRSSGARRTSASGPWTIAIYEDAPERPPNPDFPNSVRSNSSSSLCSHSRSVLKHQLMGFFVVLPVRIELTTSPLPRGYLVLDFTGSMLWNQC